jgi:RND family efflux transporter MFP subunit
VLRAPFAGEVAARLVDPGAFVRPGSSLVTLVDRSTVRLTADAPEIDFALVPPGTKVTVHLFAVGRDLAATITRRAPAADPATRTVRFEIDIPDPTRVIPVGTTGDVRVEIGAPLPASELPLFAATVRGSKASLFVVDGTTARRRTVAVLGEAGGVLFVEPALAPGTPVVAEGRALLEDGDAVAFKELAGAWGGEAVPDGGRPALARETP